MSRARMHALEQRHAALDAALAEELARPAPNLDAVRDLKRRKLALKDEIAGLARSRRTA